jgi:broad specificity phosphatase PhoE
MAGWLEWVIDDQGRVVAVTHAAVVRAAIVLAVDAKPASFWRIDIAPLCRVRLRGEHGRWSVLSMG